MSTKKRAKTIFEEEFGPATFSHFMIAARVSMDRNQVEMAKILGISKANLCDIEKGRQFVSPEFAFKIAKTAGLSELYAVQLALKDLLRRAGLKMDVHVTPMSGKKVG